MSDYEHVESEYDKPARRDSGKTQVKQRMKTKLTYQNPPPRGMKLPHSDLYRYTVCRLSDGKERLTNRKPSLRKPWNWMIWDNVNNCQA